MFPGRSDQRSRSSSIRPPPHSTALRDHGPGSEDCERAERRPDGRRWGRGRCARRWTGFRCTLARGWRRGIGRSWRSCIAMPRDLRWRRRGYGTRRWPDRVLAEDAMAGRHDGGGDDAAGADGASVRLGAAAAAAPRDLTRRVLAPASRLCSRVVLRHVEAEGKTAIASTLLAVAPRGRKRLRLRLRSQRRSTPSPPPIANGSRPSGECARGCGFRMVAAVAIWPSSARLGGVAAAGVQDRGPGRPEMRGTPPDAGGGPSTANRAAIAPPGRSCRRRC